MNPLDDNKDLFLHDFSKGAATDEPATSPTPEAPADPNSQRFDFGEAAAQSEPAKPAKPGFRARWKRRMRRFVLLMLALLAGAFAVRYYVPHTTETRTRGYLRQVEKRGLIFRTFEGEMITEDHLTQQDKVYRKDFTFSIPSDSLARMMQEMQCAGRMVEVTSKSYYGTLPWRGASTTIITDVKEI